MRLLSLLMAASAPLLAPAIKFTSPAAGDELVRGGIVTLEWSSVATDPESFSVYLVNFVDWPPFYTPVSTGPVGTAAGRAEVRIPCGVDGSYGFQFNAINGTNVYIIYAQTDKFFIGGGKCADPVPESLPTLAPAPAPAPPAVTCAAAKTVTVTATVTVRGNYTFPAPRATATAVPVPLPRPVGSGVVTGTSTPVPPPPPVIGWGGSYERPVKLTEIPRPGFAARPEQRPGAPTTPDPRVRGGGAAEAGKGATHQGECGSRRRKRVAREQVA